MSVDIKELFESGAHFGHKTSRWHPKMAPYIHSVKGDQHIINLDMTVEKLEEALVAVEETAARGKQVLFVGTKRQASGAVKKTAEGIGQPYVSVRWMGGMLTNNKTMGARIKHLKKLEEKMANGELASRYNKLEVQRFQEEIDSLNHNFGGIKDMNGAPGIVVITDLVNESIAVKEAQKLNIPILGIADSNSNPTDIEYPVPANDDSIKALELLLGYIAGAVAKGKLKVKKAPVTPDKKVATKATAKESIHRPAEKPKADNKPVRQSIHAPAEKPEESKEEPTKENKKEEKPEEAKPKSKAVSDKPAKKSAKKSQEKK